MFLFWCGVKGKLYYVVCAWKVRNWGPCQTTLPSCVCVPLSALSSIFLLQRLKGDWSALGKFQGSAGSVHYYRGEAWERDDSRFLTEPGERIATHMGRLERIPVTVQCALVFVLPVSFWSLCVVAWLQRSSSIWRSVRWNEFCPL